MKKSLNILLIEHDVVELMKFNRVLNSLKQSHNVTKVSTNDEALDILKSKAACPDIIVMNTHLQNTDGKKFLTIIKQDKAFQYIPAIILSAVENPHEITDYYRHNLCSYLLIPFRYDEYADKIKHMLDYWCTNEFIEYHS